MYITFTQALAHVEAPHLSCDQCPSNVLPWESVPAHTKSMRDRIDLVFVIGQAFVSAVHVLSLRLSGQDAVTQCPEDDCDKTNRIPLKPYANVKIHQARHQHRL